MGGNFLLKLNIDSRPIANKYREGKMKRTLERELKVPEIAEREANETSLLQRDCCRRSWRVAVAPQGSQLLRMRFSAVFLVVKSQRQLGVRRNLPEISCSATVVQKSLVWSPTSTEDCGRCATWAYSSWNLALLLECSEASGDESRSCCSVKLTKCFYSTRLETRTKESSFCVSVRVANLYAEWK